MYQRSCDVFLGLPWNILSYSVLTHILAAVSGYKPGELVISLGDTHIYIDHVHQVEKQIIRKPMSTPVIVVSKNISEKLIEDICVDDFEVYGYFPHAAISARMSV
jgi:thymidylate synthase